MQYSITFIAVDVRSCSRSLYFESSSRADTNNAVLRAIVESYLEQKRDMNSLLRSMRLPFLILTLVSIFLGFTTASKATTDISYADLFLVLLAALSAHISVNTFNEYSDYRSGLDLKTTKTPFSGGSGALIDNPGALNYVLYIAIATLALSIAIGLYFSVTVGASILPIGLVGVVIIVTYTTWLNQSPFLCLIAPGISFGPLMVVGTHLILSGEHSNLPIWASLVPFFLVNNLLLLNQFPDICADKSIGRRHVPIVYGIKTSTYIYGIFALAACLVVIAGVYHGLLPALCMLTLLPIAISANVFFGALKNGATIEKLTPYLAKNVAVTNVSPLVLGICLILG